MSRLKGYGLPAALVALAVGIAINFALLVPALGKLSLQAMAGKQARARQCSLYDTGLKEQRYFARQGVITGPELRKYKALGPYCAKRSVGQP